jgi:hypothetical protein
MLYNCPNCNFVKNIKDTSNYECMYAENIDKNYFCKNWRLNENIIKGKVE